MDFSHLLHKNIPYSEYTTKTENTNTNNNIDPLLPNLIESNNNKMFNYSIDYNNLHNNLNNNIISNFNQHNFDDSNDDTKARNRRRSKNDNDGRSHKCNICGKAYLSYPALYTHIKTKHEQQGNHGNKGRGRLRKENGETDSFKELYSPATFDYFKNPEKNGETENINNICQMVFDDLYTMSLTLLCKEKYKHTDKGSENIAEQNEKLSSAFEFFRIIENYKKIENYSFYNRMCEFFESPQLIDDSAPCDEVFYFYLYKVSKLVNEHYFIVVLKFITLFREFVNITYKNKGSANIEFTEEHNPEDVPDISNEFIIDFLGTEELLFGYSREEGIELTQNLCMWLYDNNYTSSKVSLING
jgi:hypothetical protein